MFMFKFDNVKRMFEGLSDTKKVIVCIAAAILLIMLSVLILPPLFTILKGLIKLIGAVLSIALWVAIIYFGVKFIKKFFKKK